MKRVLLVCGGLDEVEYSVATKLESLVMESEVVVHGGMVGAEDLAGKLARKHSALTIEIPAVDSTKRAMMDRNITLLRTLKRYKAIYQPSVIALPGHEVTDLVKRAIRMKAPVEYLTPSKQMELFSA